MFLAGLAGSVIHCAPMCGGFVLGQVADKLARMPAHAMCEWRRLGSAALVPYHLGRLTTYGGLGAIAAFGTGSASRMPALHFLPAVLLLLAAAFFLAHGLKRLSPALARYLPAADRAPASWSRLIGNVTRAVDRSSVAGGYLLGVALGFLPCGFLYGVLIAASATVDPARGAAAMIAFGLGTVPALVVVGVAGQAAGRVWSRGVARLAPAVLLLNAGLLCAMAVRWI